MVLFLSCVAPWLALQGGVAPAAPSFAAFIARPLHRASVHGNPSFVLISSPSRVGERHVPIDARGRPALSRSSCLIQLGDRNPRCGSSGLKTPASPAGVSLAANLNEEGRVRTRLA